MMDALLNSSSNINSTCSLQQLRIIEEVICLSLSPAHNNDLRDRRLLLAIIIVRGAIP